MLLGVCVLSGCTSLPISETDDPTKMPVQEHELKNACEIQQVACAAPRPLAEKWGSDVFAETGPEAPEEMLLPKEHLIKDFPLVYQMPELPTGCEITAMTMVLHYYRYPVAKEVMASRYLPTASSNLRYGDDGRLYGSDLRKYFVGDPFSQSGYICGAEAIVTAANQYLQEQDIGAITPI